MYDVRYSERGDGFLIFRFSIIKEGLAVNSILFGLPADDPESENILRELNDSLMKAFSDT
jgi:hypothetical protein